jgi:acetyltransferase-like isoleucine patch superfamily enzyme
VPPLRDSAFDVRQRMLDRARGEPNIAKLVADGMELGEHTHIAHPIYFDRLFPWLITIEDHVTLSPYVAVITHDASLQHYTGQTRIGRVIIRERVQVGVGAVLLPGAIIGEDSVIGANAVVSREVPAGSMVVGNPAEVSPLKPVVGFQRASAKRAPTWPHDGWTNASGITEERKREQRQALDGGGSGFVPATAAPASPLEQSRRGGEGQ